MESRKMILMNLFSWQQQRNRHREQTYGHRAGGGEDGRVRCMERVTRKLTLPYVKQIANGNLFRKLKQGLCINLEGWDGEGNGREANYYKYTLNNFKMYQMKIREKYK